MTESEHIKMTEKAIDYMYQYLDKEITTEEIAAHVGYSTYHFIRIFKEVTGITPRHYLSALRIESSKFLLLHSTDSNLKTLLSIGFRSMGSFSSRFKQYVGLSPKSFRKKTSTYAQQLQKYQEKGGSTIGENIRRVPYVTSYIEAPASFKGLIFIGLFPRPIPDQRPAVGTAIKHTQKYCVFSEVPKGEYYVMAAGLPWGLNPKNYIISKTSLRGKSDKIIVSEDSNIEVKIELREPLPFDPPILINLPYLLFENDKKS
ncbi:helix-turn-helix protein [Bacillus oleivorans]|uniref:Helix-turn-helix protein n=1 Tax=Bacillus oleivorans TaxID=1448271 RepID=A0A285D2X6_9BACI|nr:helix-turn-helix transcriptional regulator [Bacillus oleivorans]SNX74025.1 helix-turn-helix protein [Bacillus oleivorans]